MIKILPFLKALIPFTLLLFVVQYYTVQTSGYQKDLFYSTQSVYGFLLITTLLIYILLLFVNQNFPDFTGFAFLGTTFIKMMAAVVFLWPLIKGENVATNLNIGAFFIPYFLFLLFETVFAVRLINKR